MALAIRYVCSRVMTPLAARGAVRFYDTVDQHSIPTVSKPVTFAPRSFRPPKSTDVVDPATLLKAAPDANQRPAAKKRPGSLFAKPTVPAASATAASATESPSVKLTRAAAAVVRAKSIAATANPPKRSTLVLPDPPAAKAFAQPWRLTASLLLQRTPVVAKPLEQWQEDWTEYKARRFVQKVRPVDFIRPEALLAPDEAKTEEEETEEEESDAPKFDYEAWDAAQNNEMDIDQVPVPLVTKDDQTNNHKSLHRKLWDCLYLIVKKPRSEHAWQFPQGGFKRGESLREAAEREFKEECGKGIDYHTICNHPVAVHQYEFPAEAQKQHNAYGARVFFVPALYLNGDIKVDGKEIVDYAWVTADEMKDYLSPDLYAKAKLFLM